MLRVDLLLLNQQRQNTIGVVVDEQDLAKAHDEQLRQTYMGLFNVLTSQFHLLRSSN